MTWIGECREGPGEEYKIFFTHLPDVELEIVGRYEPTNFWLVKSPQSQTGTYVATRTVAITSGP